MPGASQDDLSGSKAVYRKAWLAIVAVVLVVLVGALIIGETTRQARASAQCTEGAFAKSLSQLSRAEGTRIQLASSNSFRCEGGFAAVKVSSETSPGSGILSDLDPLLMLFVSDNGSWKRQSIKTDCSQVVSDSIYETVCR